ncbi:MAG: tripartite tricarboxylate transporter TctB family protein [Betaproteobacteria bacterium]|nr:tripartite tricarboxylate transporter TctB family protein [Betaproteobacteria bacterium]
MNARSIGLLTAVFFLLLGSAQVLLSLRLPGGLGISAAEPGPGLFPAIVGAMMAVAASIHLLQTSMARGDAEDSGARNPIDIVLLIGTLSAYILLLPRAGFLVSAFLLLLGTLSIFGMPGLIRRAAMSALMTGISYLIFTQALRVNLPAPTWFS